MPGRTLAALAILVALPIVGCSSDDRGLVSVSGAVTFDGGPPPAPGIVQFLPLETPPGGTKRTARGRFDTDGQYSATSYSPDDGLYPGKYAVTVVCNKHVPDDSKQNAFRDASYIADGYQGTELVVEADQDEMTFDLDVPLKKM
jgi:hypothetical protein